MMRKPASLFFLVLFLFNLEGYYAWFTLVQFRAKEEMEQEIRRGAIENELVVIEIMPGDEERLHWEQPGREFKYKGEMYDVVRVSEKNGSIVYHCINDEKEDNLISAYHNMRSDRQTRQKISSSFSHKYIFEQEPFSPPFKTGEIMYTYILSLYMDIPCLIDSPPPENMCLSLA